MDKYKHREISWEEFTKYLNKNPVHFATYSHRGKNVLKDVGNRISLHICVYYRNNEEFIYKLYFASGTYVDKNSQIKSWMKYYYLDSAQGEDTHKLYEYILNEFFGDEEYTEMEIH